MLTHPTPSGDFFSSFCRPWGRYKRRAIEIFAKPLFSLCALSHLPYGDYFGEKTALKFTTGGCGICCYYANTPHPLGRIFRQFLSTVGKVQTPSDRDISKATFFVVCAITPPLRGLFWRKSARKFVPGCVVSVNTSINSLVSVLYGSSFPWILFRGHKTSQKKKSCVG